MNAERHDAEPLRLGVVCWPTHGGSGVVAIELALAMARAGHEIDVISYAAPARLPGYHPRVRFHAVEVPRYPLFQYPPYALTLAAKLAEVTEARGLQVLHLHYAIPHTLSAHLAREMLGTGDRPALVTTLHGTDITLVGSAPAFRRVTRFALERSDAVTAVSRWLADESVAEFGPCPAIRVIPNFVDVGAFRPRADRRLDPERPVLAHVSNFRPVKRVGDVVRAFALVRRRLPEALLLMVGEGPDRDGAEALARELGVSDGVRFLGQQDGLEHLLPDTDCFLLPSDSESFGLAALEAMACGVPAIGTRVGGLADVIRPGVDGDLCEPGNPECLAESALAILGDPARHAAMRTAARARAVDAFALEAIAPRYEAVYREVLRRSGESSAAPSAAARP